MSNKEEVDLDEAVCGDLDDYLNKWEEAAMKTVAVKEDLDDMAVLYGTVKRSVKNTREILQACDSLEIDLISVGKETQYIRHTITWPFKHERSLFTRPHSCSEGWPSVWKVVDLVKDLKGSAGNSNQKQFTGDVIQGVFLKRNGTWFYVVK